jgi:hypothetical protein
MHKFAHKSYPYRPSQAVPVTPLAKVSARHVEMIGLFQIVCLPSALAANQDPSPRNLGPCRVSDRVRGPKLKSGCSRRPSSRSPGTSLRPMPENGRRLSMNSGQIDVGGSTVTLSP